MVVIPHQPRQAYATATCPRCGSADCPSNRIDTLTLGEAAEAAWRAQRAGSPAKAFRTVCAWGCVTLANAARDRWQCDYCRETFR